MRMITIFLPESRIQALNDLVREGHFPNRAEAIREAIRDLVNYYEDLKRGDVHDR